MGGGCNEAQPRRVAPMHDRRCGTGIAWLSPIRQFTDLTAWDDGILNERVGRGQVFLMRDDLCRPEVGVSTYQFKGNEKKVVDDKRPFATVAITGNTEDDGADGSEHLSTKLRCIKGKVGT